MLTALAWLHLALQQPKPVEAPRLVVVIAVDQLVPEQMQRLAPKFTGGFKRFLEQGAVFWRATVDYANTETGPGHATLATGRYPSRHGIVGNAFVEREGKEIVYCVADDLAHPVTSQGLDGAGKSFSPAKLIGDALGDILEARRPGSKTVTVAGKDRAAILLGGRQPEAALWWHGGLGGFSTSSYYGERCPEFVSVWNSAWRERARGWKWECMLRGDLSALGTGADDRPGEANADGRRLPRTLPGDDARLPGAVLNSPLLDFFTIELATLAVDALGLGRDEAVDFLGLGLSACDILGHGHGPDSVEVTDLLLRDDRDLGRFFELLDQRVGAGRWLACLSSDHGVLDLPEVLQERGVGARRMGAADVGALREQVQDAIDLAYPGAGDLGLRFLEMGFTFDEARASAAGIEPSALRRLIAEAAREVEWVADAYPFEELLGVAPRDPWVTLYQRCQSEERGADVVVRPMPWLLFDLPAGTGHGSPYPYDRRVPLAFLGGKVKPQQRFDAASPTDAVPTLLALLGMAAPADLDGRVLKVD